MNLINECIDEYKDIGKRETNSEKFKEYWDKKEKILSVFVNHDVIDDIEI